MNNQVHPGQELSSLPMFWMLSFSFPIAKQCLHPSSNFLLYSHMHSMKFALWWVCFFVKCLECTLGPICHKQVFSLNAFKMNGMSNWWLWYESGIKFSRITDASFLKIKYHYGCIRWLVYWVKKPETGRALIQNMFGCSVNQNK